VILGLVIEQWWFPYQGFRLKLPAYTLVQGMKMKTPARRSTKAMALPKVTEKIEAILSESRRGRWRHTTINRSLADHGGVYSPGLPCTEACRDEEPLLDVRDGASVRANCPQKHRLNSYHASELASGLLKHTGAIRTGAPER
jgi:hypothetical protein